MQTAIYNWSGTDLSATDTIRNNSSIVPLKGGMLFVYIKKQKYNLQLLIHHWHN